jgi:hypothetical protein
MSEREGMPVATAAVVGNTKPSVLERNIGETVRAKMTDIPGARAVRDMVDRKERQGGGHSRG